jgi:hypothetical protein
MIGYDKLAVGRQIVYLPDGGTGTTFVGKENVIHEVSEVHDALGQGLCALKPAILLEILK